MCTSYLIIKSPNKTKKKGEVHINNTINYLGFKENMFEEFQTSKDLEIEYYTFKNQITN